MQHVGYSCSTVVEQLISLSKTERPNVYVVCFSGDLEVFTAICCSISEQLLESNLDKLCSFHSGLGHLVYTKEIAHMLSMQSTLLVMHTAIIVGTQACSRLQLQLLWTFSDLPVSIGRSMCNLVSVSKCRALLVPSCSGFVGHRVGLRLSYTPTEQNNRTLMQLPAPSCQITKQ